MKKYHELENKWNNALKVPYTQISILLGKNLQEKVKYVALNHDSERIASGNTLSDLNFSLNQFFSIN